MKVVLKNRTVRVARQTKSRPSRRAFGKMARRDREAMLAREEAREANALLTDRTS